MNTPDLYGICDYCGETNWVFICDDDVGETVHLCKKCKEDLGKKQRPDPMYKELILDQMKPVKPTCPYCRIKLKVDKKKGIGRCPNCGFSAKKGYW